MDLGKVINSGLWIYFGGLIFNIIGYIYWIILSRFLIPEVIGSASAILAMHNILISIFSFGLPTGIRFFIGKYKAKEDFKNLDNYFLISLIWLFIINLSGIFILISFYFFSPIKISNLNTEETIFVFLLLIFNFWLPIFISFFSSILRTKLVAFAQIFSALLKFSIGIIFLYLNLNLLGIMMAFIFSFIFRDVFLMIHYLKIKKKKKISDPLNFNLTKDVFKTSLPSWIPNMLNMFGQYLGTLFIYGNIGEYETGVYHMAFTIILMIYALPQSIQGLMFPILSGMTEGKKIAVNKVIKLSLIVITPISLIIAIYPKILLSLLGDQFISGAIILTILSLGAIIYPIYSGYYTYIYAMGNYKHVLILGSILNLSRIILYFLLGDLFSEIGVAFAYTIGILISIIFVRLSSKIINFRLEIKEIGEIILIPSFIITILYIFNINFLLGIPIFLFLTIFLFTRLNLISKRDLYEISSSFLSDDMIQKIKLYFNRIINFLFGES